MKTTLEFATKYMFGFVSKLIWFLTTFPILEKWKTIMENNVIPRLVFNIQNLVFGVFCFGICSLPAWEILIANRYLHHSCTQFSNKYMCNTPAVHLLGQHQCSVIILYLTEVKNKQIKLDFSILSGNFLL